jgi:uncharacterized protein YdeI (YjbR/CyaY-like superfamily)
MPYKKFKAPIEREGSALGWKIVDVPFNVKKAFGKGGRVPVAGTVNGFAFRTSLFPRKNGPHFLMLNKQMLRGANASEIGEVVTVEIEVDTKERTVATPKLMKDAFSGDDDLLKYFESMSYSMRKWMADYVANVKSPAAKKRHAEELAEILLAMMEGEMTPPPILLAEFAHNPKAKKGWELSPLSHKRSHLWGIFYYKSPEARSKRLAKAITMMVEYAEKKQ